jgi:hypothetical protein
MLKAPRQGKTRSNLDSCKVVRRRHLIWALKGKKMLPEWREGTWKEELMQTKPQGGKVWPCSLREGLQVGLERGWPPIRDDFNHSEKWKKAGGLSRNLFSECLKGEEE